MMNLTDLIAKYDVPAPRYTSYPTVPYWDEMPNETLWQEHLQSSLSKKNGSWSLYLHIPFCETLCTFCGCNTIITRDHKKEVPYIETMLQEWALYLEKVPALRTAKLKHLHLGGGTPTFLSAESLLKLLNPIFENVTIEPSEFEASIEVDPRRTNAEQLKALFDRGFRRVSLGVQDFNPEVQNLVNRFQPFAITADLTKSAREIGYTSVNFDLIYGLAKQTVSSMTETVVQTISLNPDRIYL
jgi:oxygen-independent coproporphyrinogen-3 oxidase